MLRKLLFSLILSAIVSTAFASTTETRFVILPNVNAVRSESLDTKVVDIVKQTLNISNESAYKTIRINRQYNKSHQINALIVYLLSAKFKSVEIIRINLNADMTVASVIKPYRLQQADLMQYPAYAHHYKPYCPDASVQFVIGNNFNGDASVEKEVQVTYQMAKAHGYNPVLMDVNNASGPQPTIEAYENWMSCPNVKGFYNESHGWEQGILLSDGEFTYGQVEGDLVNQFSNKVTLFDSCETFHDPLLDSMMNKEKGNAQQYVAGIISLPFGASERTATCFWKAGFDGNKLNRKMLNNCAFINKLKKDGYGIGGNGDNHLTAAG